MGLMNVGMQILPDDEDGNVGFSVIYKKGEPEKEKFTQGLKQMGYKMKSEETKPMGETVQIWYGQHKIGKILDDIRKKIHNDASLS
jgi:gamma-glutamyltranspeptidase